MLVKLEEVAYFPFSVRDPSTGNAANGTINSVTVYEENGVDPLTTDAASASLTATGQYSVSVTCTAASGFEVGKTYSVRVNATVGDITDETQVGLFQVSVENHGIVIDDPISKVATDVIIDGDQKWTTATETDISPASMTDLKTHGDTQWSTAAVVDLSPQAIVDVWSEVFYGISASNLISMAAVGAGAGKVDTGVLWDPGDQRTETFTMPDGTTVAFIVNSDKSGNRQTVTYLP